MFNCIGSRTAFVNFKNAKPHPVALCRWMVRMQCKSIFLSDRGQHLRVKENKKAAQGTRGAPAIGKVLNAPWLATARAAVAACYQNGKLSKNKIDAAKLLLAKMMKIITSDYEKADDYNSSDVDEIYLRPDYRTRTANHPEASLDNQLQQFLSKLIADGILSAEDIRRITAALCIDDTELSTPFNSSEDEVLALVMEVLEMITDSLADWCSATKMFIAAKKCEAIILHNLRRPTDTEQEADGASEAELAQKVQAVAKKFDEAVSLAGRKIK
ncbi:unnamed protein product, partial [Amoebophrya sp. A120]|eukprot:GSA120T00026420001.1